MKKLTITTPYHVAPNETTPNHQVKSEVIFNWLQDSMLDYSDHLGLGYNVCKERDLTYILRGYDIQINELPRFLDSTFLQTKLSHITQTSFFFEQTLYDKSLKKQLLTSSSQAVLVDAIKGRPVKIKDNLSTENLPEPINASSLEPIQPIERVDSKIIQEIPFDYIDFNQHVNNSKYISLAERGLSPELLKKMRLKRIAVAYKSPAKLGDQLEIQTQISPTSSQHQIVQKENPKKICAQVRFDWLRSNSR